MLSTPASNALLKTLEEPPSHVVFVLATTDPQKVLPTIRSRTQHFEFRLLGPETLEELLSQVRRDAQLDIPDEAVDLAVRRGRGSARDALSVLDQVAASDWVDDDLPEVDEVVEALAEREVGRALVALAQLTSAGYSPQQLAGDLVDHLRQGFLALVAPDLVSVSESEHAALAGQAERVGLATLVRAMEVLGQAQVTMRDAPDPRVTLEVALVRLAHPEVDATPGALLARIERLESSALTGVPPSASLPPAARSGTGSPSSTTPSPAPQVAHPTPIPGPAEQLAERARSADEQSAADPVPTDPVPPPAPPGADKPAEVSPPDESAVPFPTRDQLVQAWGDHIIGRLRPKAKALFQAGRFVGVEGDRALFGLPNETHRVRCEEVRGEIESALAEHFSRPVPLTLIVDTGSGGSPVGDSVSSPSSAPANAGTQATGTQATGTQATGDPGHRHPGRRQPHRTGFPRRSGGGGGRRPVHLRRSRNG